MLIDHITSLGYDLDTISDPTSLEPLLHACGLKARSVDAAVKYRIAKTTAGGIAACVGWRRMDEYAIIHSLAVAPTSRGGGLGMGLLATVMADLKDNWDIKALYVEAKGAQIISLFSNLGFYPVDRSDIPEALYDALADLTSTTLVRSYDGIKVGLDKCAFQLVENRTEDATTPLGSVFLFKQRGSVVESFFRGGNVKRGHLLGRINEGELFFFYQTFALDGGLKSGNGTIHVHVRKDGRRELREKFTTDRLQPDELILREL